MENSSKKFTVALYSKMEGTGKSSIIHALADPYSGQARESLEALARHHRCPLGPAVSVILDPEAEDGLGLAWFEYSYRTERDADQGKREATKAAFGGAKVPETLGSHTAETLGRVLADPEHCIYFYRIRLRVRPRQEVADWMAQQGLEEVELLELPNGLSDEPPQPEEKKYAVLLREVQGILWLVTGAERGRPLYDPMHTCLHSLPVILTALLPGLYDDSPGATPPTDVSETPLAKLAALHKDWPRRIFGGAAEDLRWGGAQDPSDPASRAVLPWSPYSLPHFSHCAALLLAQLYRQVQRVRLVEDFCHSTKALGALTKAYWSVVMFKPDQSGEDKKSDLERDYDTWANDWMGRYSWTILIRPYCGLWQKELREQLTSGFAMPDAKGAFGISSTSPLARQMVGATSRLVVQRVIDQLELTEHIPALADQGLTLEEERDLVRWYLRAHLINHLTDNVSVRGGWLSLDRAFVKAGVQKAYAKRYSTDDPFLIAVRDAAWCALLRLTDHETEAKA